MAHPFSIFTTLQGDVARVYLSGDIGRAAAPLVVEHVGALVDGGALMAIVVDLLNASFVDANGVGALVQGKTRAAAAGRTLYVVSAQDQIARVFALARAFQ